MKTKTRFAKRLVVVTCALVVTQSALAFYNPQTGRWLSRDPAEEEEGGENLYAMNSNDPLSKVDYLGKYQIDFHFYTIYYLLRAKCFSQSDAYSIAYYSQNVDDDPLTDPVALGIKYALGDESAGATLAHFHFINSTRTKPAKSGDSTAMARALSHLSSWKNGNGRPIATGWSLHTLADTWAHDGFTAYRSIKFNGAKAHPDLNMTSPRPLQYIGHSEFGSRPDFPFLRRRWALNAAKAIYALIPKMEDCACTPLSWAVVNSDLSNQFSSAGSEYDRSITASQLIGKRFGFNVWYYDHKYDHDFDAGK